MTIRLSNIHQTWANTNHRYVGLGLNIDSTGYRSDSSLLEIAINDSIKLRLAPDGILYANTANGSNAVGTSANVVPAFDKANTAHSIASAANTTANSLVITVQSAYGQANTANNKTFDSMAPTTTRGDIIYRNATVNTRLGVGAAGYLLQTNGANTDPTWEGFTSAAFSGAMRTWQAKNGDWVNADDFSSINAAVAAIGSNVATLIVSSNKTLTANLTIPSTLSLIILNGGMITKASTYTLTINGPFEAGDYRTFSGFSSGDVTMSGSRITQAEWWGAAGDGATDDAVSLQSAITAIAGRGHLQLGAKSYYFTTTLTITQSYVGIRGKGQTYTQLYMPAGSSNAINVAGTWAATIANNFLKDFYLARSGTGIGTGGYGIRWFRVANGRISDVQVEGYLHGIYQLRSTNLIAERIICSFSLGSTNSHRSFYVDCSAPQVFTVTIASPAVFTLAGHGLTAGAPVVFETTGALPTGLSADLNYYVISAGLTTDTFQVSTTLGGSAVNTSGSQSGTHSVVLGGAGGNASSVYRDCWATAAGNTGTGHVGFYVAGAYVSDLLFDACETASTHWGWYIDCSNSFVAGDEDVQLINPRADFFTIAGIDIVDATSEAMITIIGGWMDPKSILATSYGMRFTNCRGIVVDGTQFYAHLNNYTYSVGIYTTGCSNITVSKCTIKDQSFPIILDTTTYSAIEGNQFYNPTGISATTMLTLTGCTAISISGNMFDGYATSGISINAGSTTTYLAGNVLNTANITTPLSDVSSSSKYGKNVGFIGALNVDGPATNNDNYIPQWNGANNPVLKNGLPVSTLGAAILNLTGIANTGILLTGTGTASLIDLLPVATPWTPTVTSTGGGPQTLTTNKAVYYRIGTLIIAIVDISIAASGTPGTGLLRITTPVAVASGYSGACFGREVAATGNAITGSLDGASNIIALGVYNGTDIFNTAARQVVAVAVYIGT